MLSAVPGLLTFTIVSDGDTERTLKLPILVHDMLGSGSPDALHVNKTLLPSTMVTFFGETDTNGASER